jgi:hypothetical protein
VSTEIAMLVGSRTDIIDISFADSSIYLVVQSSTAPPAPTAAPVDSMTDPNLLGSLGLGGDFDILGELPSVPVESDELPVPDTGSDASGDEPWIEFIECKIDLLGPEASELRPFVGRCPRSELTKSFSDLALSAISALLFPPVHFAATSSDQDQDSSEFVTPSAILSHLSFVELADLENAPTTDELSPERDIGVVGTFIIRTEDGCTSEMHLWKLKREEAAVPDAFPLMEAKTPETPQAASPFEWVSSPVLNLRHRLCPCSLFSLFHAYSMGYT